tara:strand:- start:37100 stop:38470 length:1371 start_codon:yes stop_codon:yes gene_type:complete
MASLAPFFVFFFFTTPLADDIFYHNYAQDKTTWEFLVHHYNTWTGRYFSNLMMAVNPFTLTSNTAVYPWMMIALFFVFILSLFFLVRTLIKIGGRSPKNVSYSALAFPVTIILIALFFHKMPRVTDTFYWFSGTSSHLLPICLLFVSIGLYLRGLHLPNGSMRPLSVVFVTLASFIVSGSNETLAVQWIFTLFFTFVYQRLIFNRCERGLIIPFLAALIGFTILYFAPGNAIRGKELHGGHDILLLLAKPWGLIIETTVRYISLAGLIALVAVFPTLKEFHQNISEKMKTKQSQLMLVGFGLTIFALTFVPSVWTMGGLPPRRVLNNTYLFFLLYGTFLIVLFANKLGFLQRWSDRPSGKKVNFVFAISLLILFNNFYAWKDLVNLPKYLDSEKKRQVIVSSGQGKDVILTPLAYFPTTFYYEDVRTNAEDYRNIVFAKFYNLKSVALSQDYEGDN